ncbi:MAG TPA: hypothetical protein VNY36_08400, partial [Bacteroidia bacterium]|nr:hypothetical protein [Bacteroidia bacterium]
MEEDNEYRVYRKFLSIVEAEPLLVFLKEKNIDYKIEHYTSNISTTFASTNNADQVEVKLQPNEFEVVDRLLEEDASSTIDSLPQDYYMLSFSDEELMEVLEKPDEWTQEDYILAIQLLKKHGKVLNDDMLHSMKQNRLAELRKPEHGSEAWNIAGY